MTHDEALRFWFDRVNFEQKAPLAGDFNLARIRQLLAILGNPHERLRILHVAGSKGKGSTAALIASILEAEGHRVGLFTSPHLVDVAERIQVDRIPISPGELASLMCEIRDATPPALARELTFFEIGTALGFLHFVRRRVEFALVEVGLGGRFDSTNICTPIVSIITSISLDHTQILGDTLGKIAYEKAGIIKRGVTAISGVEEPEAAAVIEAVARERGAPLLRLGVDFHCTHEPARIEPGGERWPSVHVTIRGRHLPTMTLGLIGAHQAANAAVALAAVDALKRQGVGIRDASVARGLASVHWPARLEIVGHRPLVLLDCAHNVASAQALADALRTSFPLERGGRRLLIFAGNNDKDLAGMLACLTPHFERIWLTAFNNPRCVPVPQLAALTSAKCEQSPTAADAWREARAEARPVDLICITGSVFLAGELRPLIRASGDAGV